MKQNLRFFIFNFIVVSTPLIFIGAATLDDNDNDTPMPLAKTMPYEITIKDQFDEILNDQIFRELQTMHQDFKRAKEELGRRKDAKEINDVEFSKQFENLRSSFNKKQQDFKAFHKDKKQYSLKNSQELVEKFRELQKEQEAGLKEQYLFTKKTYNRPKFETERLKIERLHEAVRTFIKLFSEEAKTKVEEEVMSELQTAQQEFKDAWYNLKNFFLPKGQETFEKEMEFKEAEAILLQEHNAKVQAIRARLEQEMNSLLRADALAARAQAEAQAIAESFAVTTERAKTPEYAKEAKRFVVPKLDRPLRSHL
jgi:hypothetical protein